MPTRKLFFLLLLGNVVLALALIFVVRRLRDAPAPAVVTIADVAPPIVIERTNLVEVSRTNQFHWAQLESEDYRTYIERLRSIGCPEQTIRDLIIADIDKLLAPRMAAASVAGQKPLKYWQPDEKELESLSAHRERLREQREIDFQKRDLIRELIGVDLVAERAKVSGQEDYFGRRLDFLPEAKRSEVRKVLEHFNDLELAMREKAWDLGEELSPDDQRELERLQQARQGQVSRLLSPAELEQYEMSLSPTAYKVRDAMFGMQSTEAEYKAIFQLHKEFEERSTGAAGDAKAPEQYAAAQKELGDKLRQQLGPERYAEYERAADPDFRQLTIAVTRLGLPRDRAVEAWEIQRITAENQQQVRDSGLLSASQKDVALQAMVSETERTLKDLLGPKAYELFRRRTGK